MHDVGADGSEVGVGLLDPLTLGHLDSGSSQRSAPSTCSAANTVNVRANSDRCTRSSPSSVCSWRSVGFHNTTCVPRSPRRTWAAVALPPLVGRPPCRRPPAVAGDHRQHQRVPPAVRPAVDAARQTGAEATPRHPPVACSGLDRCHQIGGHLLEQILCLHLDASFGRAFARTGGVADERRSTRRARPRGTRGLTGQRAATHHRTRPKGGNVIAHSRACRTRSIRLVSAVTGLYLRARPCDVAAALLADEPHPHAERGHHTDRIARGSEVRVPWTWGIHSIRSCGRISPAGVTDQPPVTVKRASRDCGSNGVFGLTRPP